MDQYLLTAFLILICGYHIDSYIGLLSFKIIVRGATAFIFLLCLLRVRSRVYLTLLLLTFAFLFVMLMPLIPPYEDQLELNLYRKTMIVCANFREVYNPSMEDHYTYLPANLYCQIPFVVWGIDIRYLYLILFVISSVVIYYNCPQNFKIFFPTLILFYPELFLSSLSVENHILSLFGLFMFLLILPWRKHIPVWASFFTALGFSFRPHLGLLYPFFLIYFLWRKEYKFIFLTMCFFFIFELRFTFE